MYSPGSRPRKISHHADGSVVYHHLPTPGHNLDQYYAEQELSLAQKARSKSLNQEWNSDKKLDWFRSFRTAFVLFWVALNSALVTIILNIPKISVLEMTADGGKGYLYVGTVFWANAGLTFFQFLFTLAYAIIKYVKSAYSLILGRTRQPAKMA